MKKTFYFHRLKASNDNASIIEPGTCLTESFFSFMNISLHERSYKCDFYLIDYIDINDHGFHIEIEKILFKNRHYLKKNNKPVILWIPNRHVNVDSINKNISFIKEKSYIKNKFYIISGNLVSNHSNVLTIPEYYEIRYKIMLNNINIDDTFYSILNSDKKTKFLSLNHVHKHHRILLLFFMYCNNILKNTYYSYLNIDKGHDINYYNTINVLHDMFPGKNIQYVFHEFLLHYIPKKLDNYNVVEYKNNKILLDYFSSRHKKIPFYFMKDSLIHIVNESFNDNIFHITEKSFKPIVYGQLFLINGSKGMIDFLRFTGYDTFDDVIDHTYDKVNDQMLRIKYISDEIKRLNSISLNYNNIKERLKNNNKKFFDKKHTYTRYKILTFLNSILNYNQ